MSVPEREVNQSAQPKHNSSKDTSTHDQGVDVKQIGSEDSADRNGSIGYGEPPMKKTVWEVIKEPGSAPQIVTGALLAVAIGVAVNATVDEVPEAAIIIVGVPGRCWLRALTATVLPLIISAMILAMQRIKEMAEGGPRLAYITIAYYVITTLIAILHSTIMTALVWRNQFQEAGEATLAVDEDEQATIDERSEYNPADVVQELFDSIIPGNLVQILAENILLAILVASVVIGCLLKRNSRIVNAVREIEELITRVTTFLIKVAPIGVFFLVLSNLMRLEMSEIGANLGFLISGALSGIFLHLLIIYPIICIAFMRTNPITYWIKNAPAWVTAWGSASSAATLPVTMRCLRERGWPETVIKFAAPLGCLVNMDGTAIYFPVVVVIMASTQGITLNPGQYTIVVLLSTLASIGTTPIPSSSPVLTVMICNAVSVPVTGMYAVVVAIDWFIDRFRTALNVTGDLFAVGIITKLSGVRDGDEDENGTVLGEGKTGERVEGPGELRRVDESRV